MKAITFLKNHSGIIQTALEDYMRWFDEGEENHKSCQDALNDLNEVKDL